MKTIAILTSFDGYPSGAATGSKPATYAEGDKPEVPDDFADLIVRKGLAIEIPHKAPPAEPRARRTKETAREAE